MNTNLFGRILLENQYISLEQLLAGLEEHRKYTGTLGDLAVAVGMLSVHDVDAIHLRQLARDESFSQAAVALGHLSEGQLAELLHPDLAERVLLGEILLAQGSLDEPTLEEALSVHSRELKTRSSRLSEASSR